MNDHGAFYLVFHLTALGDFDGDRRLDIAACNSHQFVSLLPNRMDRVTPVILSDVRAWTDSRVVRLSWQLEVRGGDAVTGVRVQRAANRDGPFEEITPVDLEPKASMTFDDLDVVPGRQYWYNLVLVFRDGETRIGAAITCCGNRWIPRGYASLVITTCCICGLDPPSGAASSS